MPPIEAVLVDVGGVLVLPDHDRMAGAFERAGVHVDRDRLDRAHYAGVAALTEFTEGDRDIWVAYNRAYARACETPEDALDDLVEGLQPLPQLLDLVRDDAAVIAHADLNRAACGFAV